MTDERELSRILTRRQFACMKLGNCYVRLRRLTALNAPESIIDKEISLIEGYTQQAIEAMKAEDDT